MGMTCGWLSKKSAESFIIEQRDGFDELFCSCCVDSIRPSKAHMGKSVVFCIIVKFESGTEHYITEADVRFMTGEQSYAI